MTYSHMANATLPSAMCRFTSEFGMGSGGSNTLLSSGKPVGLAANLFASPALSFKRAGKANLDRSRIHSSARPKPDTSSLTIITQPSWPRSESLMALTNLSSDRFGLYGQAARAISTG